MFIYTLYMCIYIHTCSWRPRAERPRRPPSRPARSATWTSPRSPNDDNTYYYH